MHYRYAHRQRARIDVRNRRLNRALKNWIWPLMNADEKSRAEARLQPERAPHKDKESKME
jgi:hypothetical protein